MAPTASLSPQLGPFARPLRDTRLLVRRGVSSEALAGTAPITHTRTGVTRQLWLDRLASAGSIEVGINGLAPSATDAIVKLPFKSDRDVYNQYVNFDGHLRTGLLMEDMDALAANVANAHCQLNRAAGEALVTASVDSIHMYREIEDAVGKDAEMKVCCLR